MNIITIGLPDVLHKEKAHSIMFLWQSQEIK